MTSSPTIIVASKNPVKIDATRMGFSQMFPAWKLSVSGISVPSGVTDQPMTSAETLQGAFNRAQTAAIEQPTADFTIGIEGGIEPDAQGRLMVFAWVVVRSGERIGQAQTGVFYLPDEVAELVRDGHELGHADDIVFQRDNSKQNTGSIGILTDDAITRTTYYVPAVVMALIPFKKPDLTWA
ncbi:MAG: inosine/xanthosine triphosphatase [Chloroflexota bacterium]